MSTSDQNETPGQERPSHVASAERRRRRRILRGVKALVVLIVIYLLISYAAMPAWWIWRTRSLHPALQQAPTLAYTSDGIPGDPLDIAIVASERGTHQGHAGGQVGSG